MANTTTYAIIAETDSDFDKSLRWFLQSAAREGTKGLDYHQYATGYAPDSIVRLSRELESFYNPENKNRPDG